MNTFGLCEVSERCFGGDGFARKVCCSIYVVALNILYEYGWEECKDDRFLQENY